ncbi:MAG: hypothetical protein WAM46_05345 [Flavobacterium sp.]
MKNSVLFILFLFIVGNFECFAQYPKLSKEVQEQEKAIKDEASKLSDEAWEKALVIIEEEAKHGKPYIPWASRPNDLPQAEIPAFPGAEGGGMFTTEVVVVMFTPLQVLKIADLELYVKLVKKVEQESLYSTLPELSKSKVR